MTDQTNTISLDEAISWTSQWRTVESTYNKHNELNGFLIPASDLQQVLDEMTTQTGVKKVRAYLGVDPTTNIEKLVLVATEPEQMGRVTVYRDLIYGKVDGVGATEPPTSPLNSGLFDFSNPCPPDCDPKSPLD